MLIGCPAAFAPTWHGLGTCHPPGRAFRTFPALTCCVLRTRHRIQQRLPRLPGARSAEGTPSSSSEKPHERPLKLCTSRLPQSFCSLLEGREPVYILPSAAATGCLTGLRYIGADMSGLINATRRCGHVSDHVIVHLTHLTSTFASTVTGHKHGSYSDCDLLLHHVEISR